MFFSCVVFIVFFSSSFLLCLILVPCFHFLSLALLRRDRKRMSDSCSLGKESSLTVMKRATVSQMVEREIRSEKAWEGKCKLPVVQKLWW